MRGIIFDLDDTLFPRTQFVCSGFSAVATYVASSWGQDRESVLATLLHAHFNEETGREFQVLCHQHRLPLTLVPSLVGMFRGHNPSISLHQSVRETLEYLRTDGWRLAILTNGDPAVQRRKVDALGLDRLVDAVIFAEEHISKGKPHPAAFHVALDRLRASVSECVCVGDDPIRDMSGAHALGLRTIQVCWPGHRHPIATDADVIVSSIVDVPRLASSLLAEAADAA